MPNQEQEVLFNAHDLITAAIQGIDIDNLVSEAVESEHFINQNYSFQVMTEEDDDQEECDEE